MAGSAASGYSDGPGSNALFNKPRGLAMGPDGWIYVADSANHCIRKVSPEGVVITVAGSGSPGYKDGCGSSALFNFPNSLCLNEQGEIFTSDIYNDVIRIVSPSGETRTMPGSRGIGHAGMVIDDEQNCLYVADCEFIDKIMIFIYFSDNMCKKREREIYI